jgi:molybdopterin synthase catalytic subunit
MVEPGPTILRSTEDPFDLHGLMQSLVTPETAVACVITGAIGMHGDAREAGFTRYSEDEMRHTADEIRSRWPAIAGVGIIQRCGILEPGMQVLMVACSSTQPHEELWEAAQFGMDRLGPGLLVDRGSVESGRSEQDVEAGEEG